MPDKKEVLLLHGAIGAKDQLEPLAELLSDSFTVYTMSFNGHGDREDDKAVFSMKHFAEDVLAFLDKNEISSIDIFGYSMGGYVAMYIARFYPERVNKITTLGTKFLWTPEIAAKEIKMLDADTIAEKVPTFAAVLEQRHSGSGWRNVLEKTTDLLTGLGNYNTLQLPDYPYISHHVTILLGDADTMVTEQESRDVAEQLPNGRFSILPDSGHPIEKVNLKELVRLLSLSN